MWFVSLTELDVRSSEPLQVISPAIAFVHWSVQVSIVPPDTVDVHSGLKAFEEWVRNVYFHNGCH